MQNSLMVNYTVRMTEVRTTNIKILDKKIIQLYSPVMSLRLKCNLLKY